jgi:hypothetical protein
MFTTNAINPPNDTRCSRRQFPNSQTPEDPISNGNAERDLAFEPNLCAIV